MIKKGKILTAHTYRGNLSRYLQRYDQQPKLTPRLDALPKQPFSQETVNAIVLWKLNRYVIVSHHIRNALHGLRKLAPNQHGKARPVLRRLLRCHGVDLAMASTLLRFTNAEVFQIIDRHAYRAVYGARYPLNTNTPDATKIATYFDYLDELRSIAKSKGVRFRDIDRILYVFDKEQNPPLSAQE